MPWVAHFKTGVAPMVFLASCVALLARILRVYG